MVEITRVDKWLVERLSQNVTLTTLLGGAKIYQEEAPANAVYPYVVYYDSSEYGNDINGVAAKRNAVETNYIVLAVTAGRSYQSLQAIADAIDSVLTGAQGNSGTGVNVLGTYRERSVRYTEDFQSTDKNKRNVTENEARTRVVYLGGEYKIIACEA